MGRGACPGKEKIEYQKGRGYCGYCDAAPHNFFISFHGSFISHPLRFFKNVKKTLKKLKNMRELYLMPEIKQKNSNDLLALIKGTQSASTPAKDEELLMEAYRGVELKTTGGYIELADMVAKDSQDTRWIKHLYEKAADVVKSVADLREIARSLPAVLDDREFEKELYLRVLAKRRTKEEYVLYAQLMSMYLKDGEFSKKLCRNIEAIFLSKRVLEEQYKHFIESIAELPAQRKMEQFYGFLNKYKMNRNIKDIYFKAAKEFAYINKNEALIAYLRYYHLSSEEDSKTLPIPDRVKKYIFKNEKEYGNFLAVIDSLKEDRDIGAALGKINERYRRKVTLDESKIAGIKSRHEGTVNRLGELLEEDEKTTGDNEKTGENEVEQKFCGGAGGGFPKEPPARRRQKEAEAVIAWDAHQKEFLEMIVGSDYVLSKQRAAEFARSKNIFSGSLIDGINELFLDKFDDLLIEEEGEDYIVNPAFREDPARFGL